MYSVLVGYSSFAKPSSRIPPTIYMSILHCTCVRSPLRSMVPGVLLGLTTELAGSSEGPAAAAADAAAAAADPPEGTTRPRVSSEGGEARKDRTASASNRQSSDGVAPKASSTPGAASGTDDKTGGDQPEEAVLAPSTSSQLDIILNKLQHCVSRDMVGSGPVSGVHLMIGGHEALSAFLLPLPASLTPSPLSPSLQCDELSVNFCFSNSKGARKRLVRALCDVPKACLQVRMRGG